MTDLRPGVLLDVDGTLLDTNYLHVLAWWQAMNDAGHPHVPMSVIHRAIGIASEGLVQHLLGRADDKAVEARPSCARPVPRRCTTTPPPCSTRCRTRSSAGWPADPPGTKVPPGEALRH